MKECCSHQEDTFGDLFSVLVNNYIPLWVLFSLATFGIVLVKFWHKQRYLNLKSTGTQAETIDNTDKIKEE